MVTFSLIRWLFLEQHTSQVFLYKNLKLEMGVVRLKLVLNFMVNNSNVYIALKIPQRPMYTHFTSCIHSE